MQAIDIMTTPVETVRPETTVTEIAKRLIDRGISAVPVVDDRDRVVGIVSEGDLMHRPESETERQPSWWLTMFAMPEDRQRDYIKSHGLHARDIMSQGVISVAEDASLAEIATTLEKHHIKRVPVVRDGKLVGIVSRANLLQGLAAAGTKSTVSAGDRELKAAVEKAGRNAGVDIFFNNIVVADGVVTLWGMAETAAAKNALRIAAEGVEGVKEVHDQVNVMPEMVRATLWAE